MKVLLEIPCLKMSSYSVMFSLQQERQKHIDKNYFKLNKEKSVDGRDHYFYFTIDFSKVEAEVKKSRLV